MATEMKAETNENSPTNANCFVGQLFPLGAVKVTPGALDIFLERYAANFNHFLHARLSRHATGDWGDLDDADKAANDAALENDTRLLSVYQLRSAVSGGIGPKVYIITEHDRASTTICLADEY